jgi:hypothetical protein
VDVLHVGGSSLPSSRLPVAVLGCAEEGSEVSMKLRLRKEIPEGGIIPRGYGVSWFRWNYGNSMPVVCYPIPLNLILRFVHDAWIWTRVEHMQHRRLFPTERIEMLEGMLRTERKRAEAAESRARVAERALTVKVETATIDRILREFQRQQDEQKEKEEEEMKR